VPLARALQYLHDAPAHQPEIARIDGDRDAREAAHDAVERRRREDLEAALARAPMARGIDDIVAGAEALDERADQLGRVLQVAVHQHHRVAARRVDAGRRRDLVTEVARKGDHPQVRIAFERVQQQPACGVAAAVVDGDHFVGCGRIGQRRHHIGDPAQQLRDIAGFVIERHDDAQAIGAVAPNQPPGPGIHRPAFSLRVPNVILSRQRVILSLSA